ncbi:MAG: helix-turn-helix domain-containing protein, partial [Patescibacteria group bacterium]
MPSDFTKFFTELGLSAPETAVYLASLQLGPTSVQEIAKKARLSRTTAYDAVASLQEHGLMSTYDHGKKKFFAAEDPERAVAHFRDEVAKMQTQVEALSRVIPEMQMMAGGERPTVRFFEGREALLTLFSDLAKVNPKSFDEVSNYDDIYAFLDAEYVKEVQKILDPTKIHTRILHRGKLQRPPRPEVEYCELLP